MAWTSPNTVAVGDAVTASMYNTYVRDNSLELAPFFGTFTDYSSSVVFTNLTKGNGTVNAKYLKVGRLVIYQGYLLWGSTTSATSSTTSVSLPFNATQPFFPGAAQYGDSGTRDFVGVHVINSAGTKIDFLHTESGGLGGVNSTNPFTWTTLDRLGWSVMYEATT